MLAWTFDVIRPHRKTTQGVKSQDLAEEFPTLILEIILSQSNSFNNIIRWWYSTLRRPVYGDTHCNFTPNSAVLLIIVEHYI